MLQRDIINHWDINIISLTINNSPSLLLNVYSDKSQTAITHLRDHEINVDRILVMAGNFNIRDGDWDPSFPHHSIHTSDLLIIADLFDLDLSTPINPGPTRFADNNNSSNSVIDLMFINPLNSGFNNHQILQNKRLPSDHAPLFVELQITPVS